MQRKKGFIPRCTALLVILCLMAAMLPQTAFATGTDTGKAIQLGASNIGGGQADNIYFGNYFQSNSTTKEPVKWRVLSNADGKLFLLSDQNLDVQPYNSSYTSITWEKSTIRTWLNETFLNAAFSTDEQAKIAMTEVVNNNNPDYNTSGGNDTTDQIFLLSIEEANNTGYFPNGDNSRISTNTAYVASYSGMYDAGEADPWWLRSPGNIGNDAAGVNLEGGVTSDGYYVNTDYLAVRPAFNLDLNSVLFTSAAEGGKTDSTVDGNLTEVTDYNGNEWKLTLLDSSRESFTVSNATTNSSGDTIAFSYSGAQTGTNEYISVIIEDNGAITHYGRILQLDGTTNSENGAASLTLPAGVTLSGTTKLYVFNEQYNGDKMTDYASALREISNPTFDTGKAIQLVDSGTAANISGYDSTNGYDYIYYGTSPIKWRVLDDQTNFDSDSDGTNDAGLFLLSDGLLGTGTYGGVYFDKTSPFSNTWQGSDAQAWCETFYSSNLTEQEQGAVLATTKSDKAFTSSTYNIPFAASNNILNGDKVFFLSAEEAETGDYGFGSDNDRKANYGSSEGSWWLRSPDARDTGNAGLVYYDGYVDYDNVYYDWAARPAFNVNLNSVLFTSAAEGGKTDSTVDGNLTEVTDYNGNEWKLTLLDSSRESFTVSNATTNSSGDTIAFSYSGAQTGTNEYISVIIEDNGAITHYGRILQLDGTTNSENGAASLTLPAGVTLSDTTKLYVFNEQYNGDKMTDYASALREISNPTFDPTTSMLPGSGTAENPYLIYTAEQLITFRNIVNNTLTEKEIANGYKANQSANGKLMADIDLSSIDNWTPIGNSSREYKGTFDGDYHTISNMTINSAEMHVGFFSYIEAAAIKNLGVVDSDVTCTNSRMSSYAAGICGRVYRSNIIDCYYTGKVTGTNGAAGGVCGEVTQNSEITNCYNAGDISGVTGVGGVCSLVSYTSIITNCYNTGTVTSTGVGFNAGGICGQLSNSQDRITNCYNTGAVSGSIAGSVCGYHSNNTISNCYYLTGTASKGVGFGTDNTTKLTLSEIEDASNLLAKLSAGGNTAWNTKLSAVGEWQYGKPAVQPVLFWQTPIENAPTYTVTIPAQVSTEETLTLSASAEALQSNAQVQVTVLGDMLLSYTKEGYEDSVSYQLSDGKNTISKGGTVLSTGNTQIEETAQLQFTNLSAAKYAGAYTGSLVFGVSVVEVKE